MRTATFLVVLLTAASLCAGSPGIILDTDFRSDVDDVGTLALLNALADNGECVLLGVIASQTGPYVVGAINAVNTWYGRGDVPIGLSGVDDQRFDDYYAPVIGNPANYPSTQSNATALDSTILYRRLLHTAADRSVIVVVIGGQTCVHRLLLSPADPEGDGSIGRSGRELVEAKVRKLVIMGGNFVDPNQREHNIALDVQAAQTVAESWPTPIVYSGFEIGRPVMTGGALTDPQKNPVAKAYELFPAGGVGTIASSSSYDQTALYCAVRGTQADDRTLWRLSEPGWVSFPDARTRFARSAWGRHRHLIRHAGDEEVAAVIEALMIQPPQRRRGSASAVRPPASSEYIITAYGATPDDDVHDTDAIQAALDAAARAGGGTVRIPRGRFVSGTIQLRDDVCLLFDEGAVLEGSADWRHYGSGRWHDALIVGENLRNVRIEGPGVVDGVACHNPKGEEGFRGPHAIRLNACRDIAIRGLTITRAGNYAILCLDCTGAELADLTIRGGHDGLHAQACTDFRVRDCDVRTGDDCFAGCDNTDFEIVNCKINSSCNGFRLGCVNLAVRDCTFWGPGEYAHLISARRGTPRTNMLSAFVHFAPADRRPRLPSDNWSIENCRMDNVDVVYAYDFERGGWQTGQPAGRIRLHNVHAEKVARPLQVLGDADRQFELTLDTVSIAMREDRADQEVLNLTRIGALRLRNVTLRNNGAKPVLRATDGNLVQLAGVTVLPENDEPYVFEEIAAIRTTDADRLQPYAANPYYWQYQGKPVLLLGGSWQDNLFNHPIGLERHLDLLQSVGGNYVRNVMSHRNEGNVFPYKQVDGKFDLDQWNEEYWRRFDNFLKLTHERDIIVQIEVFDRHDVSADHQTYGGWSKHPFNPANNTTYSSEESRLPTAITTTPSLGHPFFITVPALQNNELVLRYQRAYVDKMLAISLTYPHVLYCIQNESSQELAFGDYWAEHVLHRAREGGQTVYLTDMRNNWDISHAEHHHIYDHPDRFNFLDVSQNGWQSGQTHYDRLLHVRRYIAQAPRPINTTKIYNRGGDEESVARFFRIVFAGGASARFHRPHPLEGAGDHEKTSEYGLGLSPRAQVVIRSARMLTGAMDIFTCEPRNDLLGERQEDEAYCLARPGREYAVYFPDGGQVKLDVSAAQGAWQVRWLDIDRSAWQGSRIVGGGGSLDLQAPGKGHWAALIQPQQ